MKTITKEQVQELSLSVALRYHLSQFDHAKKATDIFDAIGEDASIISWEPFQNWDVDILTDSIWNLASDFEETFLKELGIV
jgi:hypothetical protein